MNMNMNIHNVTGVTVENKAVINEEIGEYTYTRIRIADNNNELYVIDLYGKEPIKVEIIK